MIKSFSENKTEENENITYQKEKTEEYQQELHLAENDTKNIDFSEELDKASKDDYENNYMIIGMVVGMAIGITIGECIFGNMATGMVVGMCIGLALGYSIRKK